MGARLVKLALSRCSVVESQSRFGGIFWRFKKANANEINGARNSACLGNKWDLIGNNFFGF